MHFLKLYIHTHKTSRNCFSKQQI